MKTTLYALSKLVPHPSARGGKTRVYFNGYRLIDNQMKPTLCQPEPDGFRQVVLFPKGPAQDILDKMPPDFKVGLRVVTVTIEEVK